MKYKILEIDPLLKKYENDINIRMDNLKTKKKLLLKPGQKLKDFANGHHFFGFHRGEDGWYYREWAPAAEAVYLTGDFNGWKRHAHPLTKKDNGVWELFLPGRNALRNGQKVMTIIVHDGNDVSVKIDGKEYDAKMEQENEILVNGQYEILETYCDENGNPDIENCVKDSIKILNASEWIEGDFEVDKDGNVNLILDKQ